MAQSHSRIFELNTFLSNGPSKRNGAPERHPQQHRPNLLVIGASGHVAQAFLRKMGGRRDEFGNLILMDSSKQVLHNRFLEHSRLRYQFIRHQLRLDRDQEAYTTLLRRHRINIVLDLTDLDTLPIFQATDAAGVSYINSALNDTKVGVHDMVQAIHPVRQRPRNAPHIISTGMNPGAVNIWVTHGVRHYGVPREIIHFEYDTSMATDGWRPLITWSRREFLTETVWEPTGLVEDGKVRVLDSNAMQNRIDLRPIMEPIIKLPSYPKGFLVLHEENVKLGQSLGASSRYIYAIHRRTMDYLVQRWRKHGTVTVEDLELGDNTTLPLNGSDTIGVCLEYPDRRIYYVHSLSNASVVGTNATCTQVAIGVWAGLTTLMNERLKPRVYFSSELYDTVYPHVLFSNQRVEHFICEKHEEKWKIVKHIPELHPRIPRGKEPMVV